MIPTGAGIYRMDVGGNVIGGWGYAGWANKGGKEAEIKNPHDIAVGADGTVYVAETGPNRLMRYRRAQAAKLAAEVPPSPQAPQAPPDKVKVDRTTSAIIIDRAREVRPQPMQSIDAAPQVGLFTFTAGFVAAILGLKASLKRCS